MKRGAIALAVLAVAVPVVTLMPRLAVPAVTDMATPAPVAWRTPPPLSASLERPLFDRAEAQAPADAPDLVGIVGRLDQDAVAMVRGQDGGVRTLRPGEGVDGWQLRSLAIDAAYFTRGTQSARVTLAD